MRHLLVAAVLSLDALVPAAPGVTVNEDRGVYFVTAQFEVPVTVPVALAVLTDYEHIPRFMPGIKSTVVRERGSGHAVVEQEAVSKFMLFSKRIHLLLDISEGTDALSFRDRCGKSFARYEGRWQLTVREGGTGVLYTLTAQPAFDVPMFLLKRLLERDSKEMIEQLRREITLRNIPETSAHRLH